MNKTRISTALLGLIGAVTITTLAWGHCQIPCGIYDDPAQFQLLREHIATIEKSMRQITELSTKPGENANQLVRWVMNKEDHADQYAQIIAKYFLQQRITPADANDADAQAAYVNKLVLCHKMLIAAIKAKQTTDLQYPEELTSLLAQFEVAYFGKPKTAGQEPEHKHPH